MDQGCVRKAGKGKLEEKYVANPTFGHFSQLVKEVNPTVGYLKMSHMRRKAFAQ